MKKEEKREISVSKDKIEIAKLAKWKLISCPNCMRQLILQAFDFAKNQCLLKVTCSNNCGFDNFLIISDKLENQTVPVIDIKDKEKRSYVG